MEKPQYTAAHLKGMNRHVVYDFIRERGATSKAQIVKETGISPPTVIKIVSYLVERDLVYVSAGTGVGAGVMLDGRLRRGETNKCGEIGYNVFFEDYKRTARAAGCLEQRIGYHVLEQQFALDRFSRRSQIPPALLAQMAAQVTKPLALCIANLTHVLDCSTVVLGGEVAELLGDALLDALNARLEELCLSPVRVRRPASADDGLIGMAAHITRMEVDALLEEE